MIKFLDLQAINDKYKTAFKNRFDHFLSKGHYILGSECRRLKPIMRLIVILNIVSVLLMGWMH